jgi:uncharacterized protein
MTATAASSVILVSPADPHAAEQAELRTRVLAFIDAHTTLNLATHGPEGLWAAAVLYFADELDLYFTSVAATRHGRNMTATWRIAGTINDDCHEWIQMKGVQLQGALTRVDDVAERTHVAAAYLRKFPFAAGLWHGVSDPVVIGRDPGGHDFYRIVPELLYFTDAEHEQGRRQELALT